MIIKQYTNLLVYIFFFPIITIGQTKNDYIFLSGYANSINNTIDGNLIDFNKHGEIKGITLGDRITDNNAAICDKDGNLLFYFGGCSIVDSTHSIMENGDRINDGDAWERFCAKGFPYPGTHNSIILPDPANEEHNPYGYYLIHKAQAIVFEPTIHIINELRYSYVDMRYNYGKGKVMKKNIAIEPDIIFVTSYMSACKHSNGRGWWIIQLEKYTNSYYKFLLNPYGIALFDTQSMGPMFDNWTGVGQSAFSPDGSKWMMYGDLNGSLPGQGGALIYDFDRATGHLSNMRMVETNDSAFTCGAAFSPNSRFAYIVTGYDLYQIDTWEDDLQASMVHIDSYDEFRDYGFPVTLGWLQLAPDCKIYVGAAATVYHMGVINNPDEKGKACDFTQHSIKTPYLIGTKSLPNYPHFRIDEDQICDPTIVSVFGETVWYRRNLEIYPNPSSGIFHIRLPDAGAGKLAVFNMNGQVIYQKEVSNIINEDHIDISHVPAGQYSVEFWPEKAKDRVFYGAQVLKN